MYYTNVDLYANLKQLRGLCRQEFHQRSPVLLPAAARGMGSGRLVGAISSQPPQSGLWVPEPGLQTPRLSLMSPHGVRHREP